MAVLSEIQDQIHALTGEYPGFGRKDDRVDLFEARMFPFMRRNNPDLEPGELNQRYTKAKEATTKLLVEWLVAKGVRETYARQQSEYVLKNAYKGGDGYVESMKRSDEQKRGVGNFGPRVQRRGGQQEQGIDLEDLLNTPGMGNPGVAPIIQQVPTQVSESALKSVAQGIIGPLVEATQINLKAHIENEIQDLGPVLEDLVSQKIAAIELGQHVTDEIRQIAMLAAKQMAEEMLPRRIELKRPDGEIKLLETEPRHERFETILKLLMMKRNVYIVGPKGTGKTHLGKQLRAALREHFNNPDYEVYFIDQSLTKYDVKGFKGPTGQYVETLVRRAVEHGGLMFIDEGDMWAAAALGSLNSVLANDFGAFPDKVVDVHPEFRCVIAANTIGQGASRAYVGRNPLDLASIDRFKFVIMDYDRKMERQIYGNSPRRTTWMEYIWRLRDACHSTGNPDMEPSMRVMEDIDLLDVNMSMDEIMHSAIWKGAAPDTITKILAAAGNPPRIGQQPVREREVA